MKRLPEALALVVALVSTPVATRAEVSPKDTVERLVNAVRGYKEGKKEALSPSEVESNAKLAKVANSSLAIREVSQKALGAQWGKLSAAQQADFVALVTSLFEKVAYPKSSTFFGELKIEYKGEKITGNEAVVSTSVRHPKEGLVAIDYELERGSNGWMIHDILLDEVSLATDLRSQIQKVLREESYARLLEKMRDKLNDQS